MLIIICGLPGTGKTTLAREISEKIGGILLRTDVIRKEIGNKGYSEREKHKVYKVMLEKTEGLLGAGNSVVLDATFAKEKTRKLAQKVARKAKTPFLIIQTICDEGIIKERISKRAGDESEARFLHYLEHKKIFEPLKGKHLTIDTAQSMEEQLKSFLDVKN